MSVGVGRRSRSHVCSLPWTFTLPLAHTGERFCQSNSLFPHPFLNICVKFIGSCITNMWTLNKCSKIQHGKINMKLNWKTMNHLLPTLAFSPPSYLHFALFVLAVQMKPKELHVRLMHDLQQLQDIQTGAICVSLTVNIHGDRSAWRIKSHILKGWV